MVRDEILQYLHSCETSVLGIEKLQCPLPQEVNRHKLLVLPDDNLIEMLQAALDDNEHESLEQFVAAELAKGADKNKLDAIRAMIAAQLMYQNVPTEEQNLTGKSFDDMYRIYLRFWDNDEMMDETLIPAEVSTDWLSSEWLADRTDEDGAIVLSLPPEKAYTAALWIPMGGFNECPLPLHQSLLFKAWQDDFGAVPILVTQDSWAFQVKRTPKTDEEALALAREHFVFCAYILEQVESLGQYADYLKRSPIWYFWWD